MEALSLSSILERLVLSDAEAAGLLSVDTRTIRRWKEKPADIPGPAKAALHAWLRLDELGLAWRPDSVPLGERDHEAISREIAAHREYAIELNAVLRRVAGRGGPAAPWKVDLEKRCATLEGMRISFYELANGGFSPQSYSRRDMAPDLERDRLLLEDGYAAIAQAVARAGKNWGSQAKKVWKAGKTG